MDIIQIILLAIILAISIWFHEYAHAVASYKLWDPTPKLQWRLTPNPIKHLDPIGFLMIFLIHFWWWKPVEVNPNYYKNKLKDELIVALAWPFTNLLMAFFGWFLYVLMWKIWLLNILTETFLTLFIFINIALAIFNLLPIYPLDGYRIIKFLKPQWAYFMEQNALTFTIIFLILVFLSGNILWSFINAVVSPIYNAIIAIWSSLLFW